MYKVGSQLCVCQCSKTMAKYSTVALLYLGLMVGSCFGLMLHLFTGGRWHSVRYLGLVLSLHSLHWWWVAQCQLFWTGPLSLVLVVPQHVHWWWMAQCQPQGLRVSGWSKAPAPCRCPSDRELEQYEMLSVRPVIDETRTTIHIIHTVQTCS